MQQLVFLTILFGILSICEAIVTTDTQTLGFTTYVTLNCLISLPALIRPHWMEVFGHNDLGFKMERALDAEQGLIISTPLPKRRATLLPEPSEPWGTPRRSGTFPGLTNPPADTKEKVDHLVSPKHAHLPEPQRTRASPRALQTFRAEPEGDS